MSMARGIYARGRGATSGPPSECEAEDRGGGEQRQAAGQRRGGQLALRLRVRLELRVRSGERAGSVLLVELIGGGLRGGVEHEGGAFRGHAEPERDIAGDARRVR